MAHPPLKLRLRVPSETSDSPPLEVKPIGASFTQRKVHGRKNTRFSGRPRKALVKEFESDIEHAEDEEPEQSVISGIEKPREEREYKEYFPDLQPDSPIRIVRRPVEYFYHPDGEGSSFCSPVTQEQPSLFSTISNAVQGAIEKIIAMKPDDAETGDVMIDESAVRQGPVLFVKSTVAEIPKAVVKPSKLQLERPREPFKQSPDDFYLRYIEATDEEMNQRVEYDMDEQDLCWLKEVNSRRRAEGAPEVTEDLFEKIIDILEKEWFHLTKDLQRATHEPLTHEESVCNICYDGEVENSNAIVFCDGCNLAVHQECYGVPYIPEGQWLCRKCMLSPEKPVSCLFCPNEGGAFKQTVNNQWAHLLCALWIPESFVTNPVYMEPIDGLNRIPKSRWKLTCAICKQKGGACIQCCKQSCCTAFHVTCARKAGLYMKVKHLSQEDNQYADYRIYCSRHSPNGHKPKKADDTMSDISDMSKTIVASREPKHKKARAHQHGHSPSSPVAPEFILQTIVSRLDDEKIAFTKRYRFIIDCCKYWSLKRKARRGAPLLKRLHLEPWTMYSSAIQENEAVMLARFRILSYMRDDLESLRLLADLIRKREREKLKRLRL